MKRNFHSNYKTPCMFLVTVEAPEEIRIAINVYDQVKPHTYYSHEKFKLKGRKTFPVRLPLVPEKGVFEVYNKEVGRDDAGLSPSQRGFKIVKFERVPLPTNLDVFDSSNKTVLEFVKFAEEFSERAAIISTRSDKDDDRSIYTSPDGKFVIHYVDVIIGEDGEPRRTSMRVNNKTGEMELAKSYICKYTVPERIAILLHEFSHFYLNKDHKDEFEADLNALMIYCGLGYPRKQGGTAFFKVFYRSPSSLNIERMKKIMEFLMTFDKKNFKIVK